MHSGGTGGLVMGEVEVEAEEPLPPEFDEWWKERKDDKGDEYDAL